MCESMNGVEGTDSGSGNPTNQGLASLFPIVRAKRCYNRQPRRRAGSPGRLLASFSGPAHTQRTFAGGVTAFIIVRFT
jgi:hypothetical protein